jgi:lysozyme
MGDTATAEQCEKWFREEVTEFDREIRKCLTLQPTANEEIAFLDLAYNIGVPAFCRSSALAKFNAGEPDAACGLLTLYDKVRIDGHLRVNGWQVKRRNAEAALCRAA